jgi:arginine/lysine/ornithine decarboxylase
MEPTGSFKIRFEDLTAADANRAAAELQSMIEDSGIDAELVKDRADTQDFGATLVLVLGTEAAVVLAKAIYRYVAKRGDKVVIETAEGKVLATGAAAANIDIAQTVSALRAQIDA